jgi:ATP-dependent Clp protease ATP-binding subunit ClpA
MLLGILDKGTLTLVDNQRVNFSRTVVIITSNLGAAEMGRLISGPIGFVARVHGTLALNGIHEEIHRVADPSCCCRSCEAAVFTGIHE